MAEGGRQPPPLQKIPPLFGDRAMCASCHLDSVEVRRTGGRRMTYETGDTCRMTKNSLIVKKWTFMGSGRDSQRGKKEELRFFFSDQFVPEEWNDR